MITCSLDLLPREDLSEFPAYFPINFYVQKIVLITDIKLTEP